MSKLPLAETRALISEIQALLSLKTAQFDAWLQALNAIEIRLKEERVRIAVVGTVKSGKSSFVNALLKQDLLKRGAGILTAIITRVRYGTHPKAFIRFKSWETILDEVQHSFLLLAHAVDQAPQERLNLRNSEDRKILSDFLDAHPSHLSEDYESFNQEYVLLRSFLQGYEKIHRYLDDKETESVLMLDADVIEQHQTFVSRDEYAVYMKDILLELPQAPARLEIADCQGSDSPNPNHFAMVQEYLTQCSMVLYVFSSRTGMRQADLVLLRTLKDLGLLQQTLFVANMDLTEHESLEDAQRVLTQLGQDLKPWSSNLPLYGVSALYQLFCDLNENRTSRMEVQLGLWKSVDPLIQYHQKQWKNLKKALELHSVDESLLMQSEHRHWKYVQQQVLTFIENVLNTASKDQTECQKLQAEMDAQVKELKGTKQSMQAALEGALEQLKQKLSNDVNDLFDPEKGPLVPQLYQFIQNYELPDSLLKSKDLFSAQVMTFYKTLQHQLLRFTTEELNAPLLHHLKTLEHQYVDQLREVCTPYFVIFRNLLELRQNAQGILAGERFVSSLDYLAFQFPDLPMVLFSSTLNYQAHEKLKRVYLLGKNILQKQWERLIRHRKEGIPDDLKERLQNDEIAQLKKDAFSSLEFDVRNYRENVKYLYLYKGLERLASTIQQDLSLMIEGTAIDFEELFKTLQLSQSERQTLIPKLHQLREQMKQLEC
ncbi:dynamin family protein [Deltaproteobacteria bacterium TL4]